jgi:hypothetical protein
VICGTTHKYLKVGHQPDPRQYEATGEIHNEPGNADDLSEVVCVADRVLPLELNFQEASGLSFFESNARRKWRRSRFEGRDARW